MWLTRLALRNPILILMLSLMVLVLGAVSLDRLSVDLFPNIDIPIVRVATFYSGAGPEDIEKTITQPIERAVSACPGVDRVESQSRQGISAVTVWFQYGTNLDNAQFEVSQRVAQILSSLPPGIQQPFVVKFDITNFPVVQLAMSADGMDEKDQYDLAYNVIEPQIERLPGVASAVVGGGRRREIEVQVQRDALRARGLGILDVVDAVKRSNLMLPSGYLESGDRNYNVFSNSELESARPVGEVIIRPGTPGAGGQLSAPIRISDIARVEDSTADQQEIVHVNGQRGVYLRVLKQPGANTIAVVDSVTKAMKNLRGVPDNVRLTVAFDQSRYIRAAIGALEHEALLGGLLAVAVILIFLISLSATGIIAVAIPLSIVATFVLLFFTGQTLNVFTLGGLALGVGRLVDDSIVELENISRHLSLGQSRREAVLAAAQEVAMPILVSTVTTIVVFFPVLFLRGSARNLFMPLALTIAFSLIMSFFVSRTVTPLLCLKILRPVPHDARLPGVAGKITDAIHLLENRYGGWLRWVLEHRAVTIIGILAVFGCSLLLKSKIGSEFFPDSDESQFSVVYKAPIGTRVAKTGEITNRIEDIIRKNLPSTWADNVEPGRGPLMRTMLSTTGIPAGRAGLFASNTGPHAGSLSVNLVSPLERQESDVQIVERLRGALRTALPGVQMFFNTGGIVKRMLNFGSQAPIDVEILGYDLEDGAVYARKIHAKLRELQGPGGKPLLTDVQISREENYPELDVKVDRQKAGVLGLSQQQISQSLLASLVGNTQFSPVPFTDPRTGNQYYINVRLDDAYRSKVEDLSSIFLRAPNGSMVPLSNVATVERGTGPVVINRKYLQRIIDVTANIAPGVDLGTASRAAQEAVEEMQPPEGFTVRLGGQTLEQAKAFGDLALAAGLALILVYMVLASQFKSLVDPFVIMFSVPMGVTGVFIVLYLTGTTLSVNSYMGVIMMVGIVVSNGVLLVDFANAQMARGKSVNEAIIAAGKTRLRPILMTTIATVFGLMPMALGLGEGSETNLPLARAVIGGLSVSTVFTLFLIPALYTVFERWSKRGHRPPEDDPESDPYAVRGSESVDA